MSLFWQKLVRPMMFALDPERAHELGMAALRSGLASPYYVRDRSFGHAPIELFGLSFPNPLGVAAGFDKNGVAVNELASLGFGFVEVGTVTYRPQPGNPKPRMFRLPADLALINRLGFNNDGAEVVAERLSRLERKCVVGVNIGKNKDVPIEEAVENYLATFELMQPVADYAAINVSSPNTPNLRELQRGEHLDELLAALSTRNHELGRKPLLVKIAPDLDAEGIKTVVDVCRSHVIDGIIATNTTVSRDGLSERNVGTIGEGGLSGRPLAGRSTEVVESVYRCAAGEIPVIGVGGIMAAPDAFDKIAAGATLVQAYTGFVYSGPTFAADVNRGLAELLARRGFSGVAEAIGSAVTVHTSV